MTTRPPMHASRALARARQPHGFSLVELMVSLAIGMVATVAIFELLIATDRQTRTTTASADSQMAGHLASYMLDRELQQAGYGVGRLPVDYVNCDVKGWNATAATAFSFRLAPVLVTQGTGTQPDRLTVLVGSSATVPIRVTWEASTATSKRLRSRAGYLPPTANTPGDLFLAMSGGATSRCALLQVSALGADDYSILHEPSAAAPFNPPGELVTLGGQGLAFDLGRSPRVQEWFVDLASRSLRVRNLLDPAVTTRSVAEGVVDLQAEYGIEDPVLGVRWTATPATAVEWTKVTSVRFAVAVQSGRYEKEEVTTRAPVWAATGQSLDGVTVLPEWRHYRYRVHETTASLRNVLWGR